MISGKFAITIHILTLLSKFPNEYLSSDFIASSLNMNPVLVRKEIANLKKNGLIESREGKNGGTRLAKSADGITLEDAFRASFGNMHLGFSKNEPCPQCPVGKNINANLESLYTDINNSISKKLGGISLAEFAGQF